MFLICREMGRVQGEGVEGSEIGKKTRSLLAIMCSNNPCCVYCPFNRVYITTHSDNQEMGDAE